MDAIDHLRMQLRLEGKVVVGENSLRQVEVVPDEEMPFMVIASLSTRELVAYYDEALSRELRDELDRQVRSLDFPNISPLVDILRAQDPNLEIGYFKTFTFPERYIDTIFDEVLTLHKTDPKVKAFGFDGFAEQVHAIEQDGRIVSACVSARDNESCGEAWIYTDENHRHRGFARKVVGAWAKGLLSAGRVPFYSHKVENLASAELAKRLGLVPAFEEIIISRMNV
mgnify:FL=1